MPLPFRVAGWISLLALTSAFSRGVTAMEPSQALSMVRADRVLVIAHRGNSSVAPENTLPAFRSAVALGADLVELDYFHSRDGVPVVFHDKQLDRTTDAARVLGRSGARVDGLTLEELRKLDAGVWKGERYRGTGIPTLAESLDAIQKGAMTLVEHKQGDPATCVDLLRRKKCLDRVVVQSFDWDFVRSCRRLAPDLIVTALGKDELTDAKLDEVVRLGAQAVGWDQRRVSAKEIEAAHRRGLRIWVYTVNEAPRMRELADEGIDGIITDRPALAIQVLRSKSDP